MALQPSHKKQGQLIITGIGIKLISHTTHESKLAIEFADHVFFISHHDHMKSYINDLNQNSTSLNYIYDKHRDREMVYQEIKNTIIDKVKQDKNVCVVFYGHPCVFARPGLMAIEELRENNFTARSLPGISTQACLFSDLLIDPSHGFSNFEATDLVLYKRHIDSTHFVAIWQPFMFGNLSPAISPSTLFRELPTYLLQFYRENHPVIVYQAATLPGEEFSKSETTVDQLDLMNLNPCSTIILPPNKKNNHDPIFLEKLLNAK